MAKREVVLHGIVGIELAERGRDLFGRSPGCGAAIRQTEIAADAMDVSVDRNDEFGGRDRPESEIDTVRRTNHPPGVKNETFACTSGARVADQMTQVATDRITAKRVREAGQSLAEIPVARLVKMGESVAEGVVLPKQHPGSPEHRRQMLAPVDAVNEPPEALLELVLAASHHRRRGFGTQHREDPTDAAAGRYGIAKREAGGDEPDDLLVARSVVAMNKIDRVPTSSRLGVTRCEKRVQVLADTVHFSRLLAILPTPLQ